MLRLQATFRMLICTKDGLSPTAKRMEIGECGKASLRVSEHDSFQRLSDRAKGKKQRAVSRDPGFATTGESMITVFQAREKERVAVAVEGPVINCTETRRSTVVACIRWQ